MPNQPRLEFLFDVSIGVGAPIVVGENPHGNRLIAPVTGGSFDGPRLKGKILPGGGDWALGRSDGVGELDIRETWRTDDDALLYVTKRGYLRGVPGVEVRWAAGEQIPHEDYYFVVTHEFETSAAQHAWLQQVVILGMGYLRPGGVGYQVFAVREADEVSIEA